MDGIISIHGSTQRAHRGYALLEVLIGLALAGMAAARNAAAKTIRAQQMARTRREMHGLSDHYLRDIGLDRNDIDSTFR
jgi:prepilin-type N-terminal cleavage/methylation domain-containing protein